MRKLLAPLSLSVMALIALVAQAAAPVPRQAGEFLIKEPGGKTTAVSSLKGKVVVLQFLFTSCSHCQETAKMLSAVKRDMGAKGVEIYGIAFNDEVLSKNATANAAEVGKFKTNYAGFPVGIAPRDAVTKYLGLSVMERWGVPQMVVIDKNGVIQAQSKATMTGPEPLQHEPSLRNLLTTLLNKK